MLEFGEKMLTTLPIKKLYKILTKLIKHSSLYHKVLFLKIVSFINMLTFWFKQLFNKMPVNKQLNIYHQRTKHDVSTLFNPCRFSMTVLKESKYHTCTFLNGLTLEVILYSYLQSSQHSLSELLIHFCRHSWCTNFMLPSQRQGAMRGESSSISHTSHWQIRQQSWPEDSMDRLVSHRSDSLGVGEFTWRVSYKAHIQINYNIYIGREVNH